MSIKCILTFIYNILCLWNVHLIEIYTRDYLKFQLIYDFFFVLFCRVFLYVNAKKKLVVEVIDCGAFDFAFKRNWQMFPQNLWLKVAMRICLNLYLNRCFFFWIWGKGMATTFHIQLLLCSVRGVCVFDHFP